jgi:hypothetical protein
MSLADGYITHEVENQPPPLIHYNAYDRDIALQQAVEPGDMAS